MTDKGSYAHGTLPGLAQLFKEVNSVGDIQKEIVSPEKFERSLFFQSPIPVGWAVKQFKLQQELIEQLNVTIENLEQSLEDREPYYAQEYAKAKVTIEQKDAEIERLQKAAMYWNNRVDKDTQWIISADEENKILREALEQITRYRYGSALVYVTHIKGIAEQALSQLTPIKGESNE
jgi:hypothetical protein